jgi:hypothetical protein
VSSSRLSEMQHSISDNYSPLFERFFILGIFLVIIFDSQSEVSIIRSEVFLEKNEVAQLACDTLYLMIRRRLLIMVQSYRSNDE